jgi:hypothetical protein
MTLRRMLALLVAIAVCLLAAATSAHAAVFSVDGGISDNYKASFNTNPSVRELRTWLSFDRIVASGTTWAPADPGSTSFVSALSVASADGRSAQLAVTSTSANVASVFLRTDPPKGDTGLRWGPLVTLRAAMSRATPKVRIGLTLTQNGAPLAAGVLDYWVSSFAGTGSSIEQNGPGGRWRIAGYPLDTDWQSDSTPAGRLAAAVPRAPRATGLIASRRATTVRVRASARAAQGARVLLSRYRIGSGRYSAWRRASSAYAFHLAIGSRARVTFQVRDVRGFASAPLTRVVR